MIQKSPIFFRFQKKNREKKFKSYRARRLAMIEEYKRHVLLAHSLDNSEARDLMMLYNAEINYLKRYGGKKH